MTLKLIIFSILLSFSIPSFATGSLQVFEADSLIQLKKSRVNKPFILILWSIDCPPCITELQLLQKNKQQFNDNNLVLISTDDLSLENNVHKVLQKFQLDQLNNWIFSGALAERLRYSLDPSWYGELPRAYFYNSKHQRTAHSGILSANTLKLWIKKTQQLSPNEKY